MILLIVINLYTHESRQYLSTTTSLQEEIEVGLQSLNDVTTGSVLPEDDVMALGRLASSILRRCTLSR